MDFFELKIGAEQPSSDTHDVEDLAALLTNLARATIGARCSDEHETRRLYEAHLSSLPDSQCGWRLRLLILSLCPRVFHSELRKAFFRIFEDEEPYRLISGAEYFHALRASFSALSNEDRREYISKLYILAKSRKESGNSVRFAWDILSRI